MSKFKNPEQNPLLTPVDYFNIYGKFTIIFDNDSKCIAFSDTSATYFTEGEKQSKSPTFELNKNGMVDVKKNNPFDLASGQTITKFMLLSAVKFKSDISRAQSFVLYALMKKDIPYIRVGTDYFNVFIKENRYGIPQSVLKAWDKATITEDHGKSLMSHINKYNDFTIIPNNKTFIAVANGCYNLYAKFSHEPLSNDILEKDIPTTIHLLKHIFGDQYELGLMYMKILYEHPMQILPVLSLVSTERETGKTTFLNYLQILFGENSTLINPGDLTSNYNDAYATKNIIMIDETVIDKANTIEKLKSIATAKTMSVSQKFVQHYSVPFFGKVIICTNKETDFMRIDNEEIRFWIRKINSITGKRNTKIEEDLTKEIPAFLKFLIQLPAIDFNRSRMVFTQDQIQTEALDNVKKESKSTIVKELEMFIEDFFNNHTITEFYATSKDIKERWFDRDNQTKMNYIYKVLTQQMHMLPESNNWYLPFEEPLVKKKGTAFLFKKQNLEKSQSVENQIDDIFDSPEAF